MLEKRDYCVGDVFKVFDKGLQKEKFIVLSRFVFKAEHFVLLSLSTFERWTDRELTFRNEFVKTTVSREDILYLYGDEQISYAGNINAIGSDIYRLINDKMPVAI